jgi:hypothetical protein
MRQPKREKLSLSSPTSLMTSVGTATRRMRSQRSCRSEALTVWVQVKNTRIVDPVPRFPDRKTLGAHGPRKTDRYESAGTEYEERDEE